MVSRVHLLSQFIFSNLIILLNNLFQDVTVTKDGLSNEVHNENNELLIDCIISQSRQHDAERELKPWIPDDDDPQFPELDNIFDSPWNRLLYTSPNLFF